MDIWQCGAWRIELVDAVDTFVRVYWAKPRRYMKLDDDGRFQMVGGTGATYRCRFVDGDSPVYVIEKES